MARFIATVAAGLLAAALCVSAQSSDVTIAGYTSTDCSGTPALQYTFTGGPTVCQSVTYNGMTVYGKVYCENGQPTGTFCTDSTCAESSCTTNLADAGNGVCGSGYNVFTSAKATCGSSATAASSSGTNSASSNAAGFVGIAAAAAASVAALL